MAVLQGRPSAFFKPTASSSSLRQCVLNASNFVSVHNVFLEPYCCLWLPYVLIPKVHLCPQLDPNTLALNRTAVANHVQDLLPDLPSLAAAVDTCPEPVDFDATPFLTCLKRACMSSVAQSPEMAMAQPLLKSSASPAATKTISKPPAAILPFFIPWLYGLGTTYVVYCHTLSYTDYLNYKPPWPWQTPNNLTEEALSSSHCNGMTI